MEVKNLEFSYKDTPVIKGMNFSVEKGKITTFIGANGCGKSTLFNLMTKNLKPQKGAVVLDGKNISEMGLKQFAQKAAIVHQYNTAPQDLGVRKLISYGRLAHAGFCTRNVEEDERCIDRAMEITNTKALEQKQMGSLSGGERQRVWIAMALAQNTEILFLDEPTTYLDIRYQVEILRLVKQLNRDYGITIIMILHDINQAMYYSDEVIAMKEGRILDSGKPTQIITEKLIEEIYGIHLAVEEFRSGKQVIMR